MNASSDGIHSERGWANDDAVLAGAAESAYEQVNGFIATTTDEYRLWSDAVERRESFHERLRLGLRVSIQSADGFVSERAPRQLIGMESLELWLPNGVLVRFQGNDFGSGELSYPAHEATPACRTVQPPAHGTRVCVEAFELCQLNSDRAEVAQSGGRKLLNRDAFDEVEH